MTIWCGKWYYAGSALQNNYCYQQFMEIEDWSKGIVVLWYAIERSNFEKLYIAADINILAPPPDVGF
jgi:hypothetical protein